MSEEQTAEIIEEELDQQDESGENEEELEASEEDDSQSQEGEDGEGEPTEKSGEIEIVVDDEDSQPSKRTKSIQHRINKLNSRNAESTREAVDAKTALAAEREKTKILEMALAQKQGQADPVQPNPDDFDGGTVDPQYKAQQDAYTDFIVEKKVDARFAELSQTTARTNTSADNTAKLETAALEHWKRADSLGASDYEATEDKAREYLGDDVYNAIIMNIDDSELLIYHYGKNRGKAEEIVSFGKMNPVRAMTKMAALGARLKVRPTKNKQAPAPDDALPGGKSAKKGVTGPPGATYS